MMRPQLARQHRPAHELGAEEDAGQVQVEVALPHIQRHFFGRHVLPPAADVVDEDVDGPVLIQHALAHPLRFIRREEVRLDEIDSPAQGEQFVMGLEKVARVGADEDQVGADFREGLGHGPAEAATAAGDQGPFAIETEAVEDGHGRFSARGCWTR